MRDKEERKKAREAKAGQTDSVGKDSAKAKDGNAKERTFKQKEAIVRDVREQREKRSSNEAPSSSKRFKSSHEEGNSQALQGALAKIF